MNRQQYNHDLVLTRLKRGDLGCTGSEPVAAEQHGTPRLETHCRGIRENQVLKGPVKAIQGPVYDTDKR